jgi:signal transduction histidine kinase
MKIGKKDDDFMHSIVTLGRIYLKNGDSTLANNYFRRVFWLAHENKFNDVQTRCLIGLLDANKKRMSSVQYLENANRLIRLIRKKSSIAQAYHLSVKVGDFYREIGQLDSAKIVLSAVVETIQRKGKIEMEELEAIDGLCKVALEEKKYDWIKNNVKKYYDISKRMDFTAEQLLFSKSLAEAYSLSGVPDSSRYWYNIAISLQEKINSQIQQMLTIGFSSELEVQKLREKEQIEYKRFQLIAIISFIIGLLAIILIGLLYWYKKLNKEQEQLIFQKQDLIEQLELSKLESNKLNEQLVVANSELKNFASVASHDIREPLRNMRVSAQRLINRNKQMEGEDALDLQIIFSSADNLMKFVSNLLEYTKLSNVSPPLETVDVNEILEVIAINFRSLIKEKKVILEFSKTMPTMSSNSTLILQLFQNLIQNAIRYSKPEVPPVITIDYAKTPTHHVFKVIDNGIGIPAAYLDSIFEIFIKAPNAGSKGTGLGLATCKKIADKLNAEISVESEEGVGSTFTVSFHV